MRRFPRSLLLPLLTALLFASALVALMVGPLALTLHDLLAQTFPGSPVSSGYASAVLVEIRLPRVVSALLIGASLAVSGAAMQGLFRNPLADPGLIGVSAGAALAATLWLALKPLLPDVLAASWTLPLAAFGGGAIAALLALRLGQREGQTSVASLLLAGLSINALSLIHI